MQAIILAAGVGSRLAPRTDDRPKCLVEVADVPILHRQLGALRGVGVEDVVIVTGYRAEQVRDAVDGASVEFVHNPRFRETNVLWSWLLGSERLARDHFFLHGDTVFEAELLRRAVDDAERAGILLTVDRHDCGAEEMKVVVEGPEVRRISKKIEPSAAHGEFTGVMLVRDHMLGPLRAAARRLVDQPGGGQLFVEAAVQELIDDVPEEVSWVDISGLAWREIDFEEDLRAANRLFEG